LITNENDDQENEMQFTLDEKENMAPVQAQPRFIHEPSPRLPSSS
jgi:hypothetical protein